MNSVLEAIFSRRSAEKLDAGRVPPRNVIEQVLEAAIWAPNHHLTEPWRFVVIAGDERRKLGDAMSQSLARELDTKDPSSEKKIDAEKLKPFRAPVIIALISNPKQNDPKILRQEEIVAGGAALENMLLAIHSLGLGAMVKTGRSAYSDAVKEYLKMSEAESLIGLVYLGYLSEPPRQGKRSGYLQRTEWRGL